jgi:hypothetical protein
MNGPDLSGAADEPRRKRPATKDREPAQPPPTVKGDVLGLPEQLTTRIERIRLIELPQQESRNAFYRGDWIDGGGRIPVMIKEFAATPPDLADIWAVWRSVDSSLVARLRYTFPPTPGERAEIKNYEVTDFEELGSLVDFLGNRYPDGVPAEMVKLVLSQLTDALDHLHLGDPASDRPALTHGDIKPGNILVRWEDPLELCLTDFGSARLDGDRDEDILPKMTVAYAAPEAQREVSPANDWWSVGMIVVELLNGIHPFALPTTGEFEPDSVIRRKINNHAVPLGPYVRDRWALLARGLLTPRPRSRWGAVEVRAWLGGSDPPVDETAQLPGESSGPFLFAGVEYTDPGALALAMGQQWDQTTMLIGGVREWQALLAWVEPLSYSTRKSLELASRNLRDRRPSVVDFMIAEVVTALSPAGPPYFRGYAVDDAGLLRLAVAASDGEPSAVAVVRGLYDSWALNVYARGGNATLADVERVWRRWYTLAWNAAVRAFEDLRRLPSYELLPGMLLRASLDKRYRKSLRTRADQLGGGRKARRSARLALIIEETVIEYKDDETAIHAVIVLAEPRLFEPMVDNDGKQRTTVLGGTASRPAPAGLPMTAGWSALLRRRPLPGRPGRKELPYLQRRRTPRQRALLVTRVAAIAVAVLLLAVVPGLGVADASSRAQGLLVGGALGLAGACLLLAVLLQRSRLTATLIGAWSGVMLGALVAFVAGGITNVLLGPQTGWPVFWISWAAVAMAVTAREAVR